jgi:hypothetical protein
MGGSTTTFNSAVNQTNLTGMNGDLLGSVANALNAVQGINIAVDQHGYSQGQQL